MSEQRRLPTWFKVARPGGANYIRLRNLLRDSELHTVCEEARCPNIGDCWNRLSATFMILGDICTRACRYCAVTTGRPTRLNLQEPVMLARAVERLGLRYCVITSVDRDDLPDGGASVFSQCINKIRESSPRCSVEVLIPDFQFNWEALTIVMEAQPTVLNHNIETVERIFHAMRPKGSYRKSLELLQHAKDFAPQTPTKSGMMVGLGEEWDEILDTMSDLRKVGCEILTIGQYLQPSSKHVSISRFYSPEEFEQLCEEGEKMGFKHVASGPLVRSSYHADEQAAAARVA